MEAARAAKRRHAEMVGWARDALPSAIGAGDCGVLVREAEGAACAVFAFEKGATVVVDLPNTSRGAVYRAVLGRADALLAARGGAPPPRASERRDGARLAALGAGAALAGVAAAGRGGRRAREAAAAAAVAAGVALLAYAAGAAAACARLRRRGGGPRPSTAVTRKRGAVTLLGNKALRGCPCCDFSLDDGDLF